MKLLFFSLFLVVSGVGVTVTTASDQLSIDSIRNEQLMAPGDEKFEEAKTDPTAGADPDILYMS